MGNIIEDFNSKQLKRINKTRNIRIPDIRIADTVDVKYKINEGADARTQSFKGLVIARSKSLKNYSATFTVRKISSSIGVERKFTLYSPLITSITIVKRGIVKRAKLYYIRELTGKASRIKEKMDLDKNSPIIDIEEVSDVETPGDAQQAEAVNQDQAPVAENVAEDSSAKEQEAPKVSEESVPQEEVASDESAGAAATEDDKKESAPEEAVKEEVAKDETK